MYYKPTHQKRNGRQVSNCEAARKLFIERGYSGATIEAIAQEAGVAAETVYATFGNKRAILSRLIDVSIVEDVRVPLVMSRTPGGSTRKKPKYPGIQLFARDMQEIMERMAPIFGIMRVAAKTEPDISEILQNVLESRVHGMEEFIRYITANGSLQEDLISGEAAKQFGNFERGSL